MKKSVETMFAKNWTEVQKPNKIQIMPEDYSENYAKFTIEPLEQGFGITIGHALRRVLLSSIRGAAVFAVQIEGVSHELAHIPGVVEDVIQILLNLKKLNLKLLTDDVAELELIGEGPCELKASDISTFGKVKILNEDLTIATLGEGATLSMTLYVRQNKGYVLSEENQKYELPINTIYLDSNHTPIVRVNYEVQNSRVGQRTDFEKLVYELWTNGSITPDDAIAYASKILKEHLNIFINFDESLFEEEEDVIEEAPKMNENLYRSVSELELSVRAINCLQNAKIETIGDLVQKTEAEMLKTKNFGRKSLNEIKTILSTMGLSLGMKVDSISQDFTLPETLN